MQFNLTSITLQGLKKLQGKQIACKPSFLFKFSNHYNSVCQMHNGNHLNSVSHYNM
jgi:hypothetical protein